MSERARQPESEFVVKMRKVISTAALGVLVGLGPMVAAEPANAYPISETVPDISNLRPAAGSVVRALDISVTPSFYSSNAIWRVTYQVTGSAEVKLPDRVAPWLQDRGDVWTGSLNWFEDTRIEFVDSKQVIVDTSYYGSDDVKLGIDIAPITGGVSSAVVTAVLVKGRADGENFSPDPMSSPLRVSQSINWVN